MRGVGVGIIVDVINKDVKAYDRRRRERLGRRRRQGRRDRDGGALRALGRGGRLDLGRRRRRRLHRRRRQRRQLARSRSRTIGDATVNGLGIEVKASDIADKLELYAGNISFGDSAGVGVAVVVLVRNGIVDAHVATGAVLDRRCRRRDGLGDAEREPDPRRGRGRRRRRRRGRRLGRRRRPRQLDDRHARRHDDLRRHRRGLGERHDQRHLGRGPARRSAAPRASASASTSR